MPPEQATPRTGAFMLSGQPLGGGVAYLFTSSPWTALCGWYGYPSGWGITASSNYAYGEAGKQGPGGG